MKMATYAGMNLRGEVRESISLDDDDLSDVEDEVFIRDGRNGYKIAEEMTVKRPLMAPKRRPGRPDASLSRLKQKHNCRAFCKPCCYIFFGLSVLIGLVTLVVVLVSIYPLPLDKLRDWVIFKSAKNKLPDLVHCSELHVEDVWSVNLPKLTTDSAVRTIDVNGDGVEDILFGFGTGDNYNILPPDIYCPIFMETSPPCEGGVLALNGINGEVLWRQWMNDTVFSLQCSADVNGDEVGDCLALGEAGTIAMLDSKTGKRIWQLNTGNKNVYVGNFISDQNADNISDVIASHSSLDGRQDGHIVIISGKTGEEIKRIPTPNDEKTFFMPGLLRANKNKTFVVYGTGTPGTGGKLRVVLMDDLLLGKLQNSSKSIYEDKVKGMLTQPVFVDITGDQVPDIVSSMYNSTVVAIDGNSFSQIWNYSLGNALTNVSPTPGYFNHDNVTDFLVIYKKYDSILSYNYTQTLIIDGKTGKPIYEPISGGLITQVNGLTLSMESFGHDYFLYWTSECVTDGSRGSTSLNAKSLDDCQKQSNSTQIFKLNALNEFHQPPGVPIYNSVKRERLEYNRTQTIIGHVQKYYKTHQILQLDPNPRYQQKTEGQAEIPKVYSGDPVPIGIRKYGKSSVRHKEGPEGLVKDLSSSTERHGPAQIPIEDQGIRLSDQSEYMWPDQLVSEDGIDPQFTNYDDGNIPYNQKQMIFDEAAQPHTNTRDPRSKPKDVDLVKNKHTSKIGKKNLSEKIFGYHNVKLAKNRLLHDDETLPIDILKDTFFKNEASRLKQSRMAQRDVTSHIDRAKEDKEIEKIIDQQKKTALNDSLTLWHLETENEIKERENGYYNREKRGILQYSGKFSKVTSVGAVLNSFNRSSNTSKSIDVVFIKYWVPEKSTIDELVMLHLEECVAEKIKNIPQDGKTSFTEQQNQYQRECQDEQNSIREDFKYFNHLKLLQFGQMTVYRLRIRCQCESTDVMQRDKTKCARFLPKDKQSWPAYLGRFGDGVYYSRG